METIYLVASGDLRLLANQKCEAAQAGMERQLVAAIEREGYKVKRAHPYDPVKKHGFIDSQKYGLEVFSQIPKDARSSFEVVWQYIITWPGLLTSRSGVDRGQLERNVASLVGMLNSTAASPRLAAHCSLWSEDF
jgi:hypothetical protein